MTRWAHEVRMRAEGIVPPGSRLVAMMDWIAAYPTYACGLADGVDWDRAHNVIVLQFHEKDWGRINEHLYALTGPKPLPVIGVDQRE